MVKPQVFLVPTIHFLSVETTANYFLLASKKQATAQIFFYERVHKQLGHFYMFQVR